MAAYFQQGLGINTIPSFLSASTATGLKNLMRRNNLKQKGYVMYHHIQWVESDKKWYAWFELKENVFEALKEVKASGA